MKFLKPLLFLLPGILLVSRSVVSAQQHDMHAMHGYNDSLPAADHSAMDMEPGGMTMTSSYSLNLPMSRDGSGTSWVPDATPMYMYMMQRGKTSLMFHGNLFLRYDNQDFTRKSDRGGTKVDAPNWLMMMVNHPAGGKGLLSFSAMLSLDRPVMGGAGYPLLFQTGESWEGKPLVDRQHPHDLVAALTLSYTYSLNKDMDAYVYVGYPGEPAVGPPVFMHRLSAMNDPDAPLGHHWQDATHITYGVATFGYRYKMIKAEFSGFKGREPDENRYNFDPPEFDSYSWRVSLNPSAAWALQVSQGYIKSPEALHPLEDVTRTTASVIQVRPLARENSFIASTLVWGLNATSHSGNTNSLLLETNLQLNKTAIYGRYEYVQKSAEELVLPQFPDNANFNIHALTLGYNRILFTQWKTDLSAGLQGAIDLEDRRLYPVYGKNPLSFELYLRISPALHGGKNGGHSMHRMPGMDNMKM